MGFPEKFIKWQGRNKKIDQQWSIFQPTPGWEWLLENEGSSEEGGKRRAKRIRKGNFKPNEEIEVKHEEKEKEREKKGMAKLGWGEPLGNWASSCSSSETGEKNHAICHGYILSSLSPFLHIIKLIIYVNSLSSRLKRFSHCILQYLYSKISDPTKCTRYTNRIFQKTTLDGVSLRITATFGLSKDESASQTIPYRGCW